MPETQTDFYSTLGQGAKPFNAMELMGQFAQVQNAMNQNKLFQLETNARTAMGEIMQRNVDQNTGKIDYDKAIVDMSTDPRTAYKAPDIAKMWIDQQNIQVDILNKNLDRKIKEQTAYSDAATSLLMYPDDQLVGKAASKIGELVGAGLLDKDVAMTHLSAIVGAGKDNPKGLRDYFRSVALQGMGSAKAAEMVYGAVNNIEGGGYTSTKAVSPFMGTSKEIGVTEKTPTPGERGALVDQINPLTKQTEQVPRQTVAPMYGGLGTPTNRLIGADSGSLPTGAQGAGATEAGQAPAPPPSIKALSPAETKYLEAAGGNVAEMAKNNNDVVEAGTGLVANIANLQKALTAFHAGGGMEAKMELSRLAQAFGMNTLADKIAGGDRAAAQVFQKAAIGIVLPQVRQFMQGQGRLNLTEFETILKANPNIETDPRAIGAILKPIERSVTLAQGRQQGFSRWMQAGKDPLQFEAHWQKYLQDKGISRVPKSE